MCVSVGGDLEVKRLNVFTLVFMLNASIQSHFPEIVNMTRRLFS